MRVVDFSEARNNLKTVINQVIEDADYTVIGDDLAVIACRYHYDLSEEVLKISLAAEPSCLQGLRVRM